MAARLPIKTPGRRRPANSLYRSINMKYFNLLLSLCLVFMLCTSWAAAQSFSSLATPEPTPPTGAAPDGNDGTGFPGPPQAAPTDAMPEVTTIYPLYGA